MQSLKLPTVAPDRQMALRLDANRLEGLDSVEREKVILAPAQILMQAAGLIVEEFDDDER